jgi:REP element-mobilizing transposase RayT
MSYNPAIHHRKSIRLRGFDYSTPGYYFITMCIHDRWIRMFGDVENGKMVLNDCGKIADDWIGNISGRFSDATVDSYVIMPNHVHLILHIVSKPIGNSVGVIHELPLRNSQRETDNESIRKTRRIMTIPKIIGYYRMNSAKYINAIRTTSGNPFWQRNYWEHIIRDENEHFRIRNYIVENPSNWDRDKLNGGTGNRVLEESAPYGEEQWMI